MHRPSTTGLFHHWTHLLCRGQEKQKKQEKNQKWKLKGSREFPGILWIPDPNFTAKIVMLRDSTFQFPQTDLFIFSSFLCCRTHSLDIFSFSNNTVFLLVHRNSLLLGSQSELSKFSKLSWSPFSGYAIRHKFPSSSSSKLTDTTPGERKHRDHQELLKR